MKAGRFALHLAAVLGTVASLAFAGLVKADQPAPAAKARPIDSLAYPKLHDIKVPQVVRATLPNGVKLLLVEDHDLPEIAFHAVVRGGRLAEPAGKTGLAELFGEVQRTGGTAAMKGDAIDSLLDSLGSDLGTAVGEAVG